MAYFRKGIIMSGREKTYLGLDIGGTKCAVILGKEENLKGLTVTERQEIPTLAGKRSAEETVNELIGIAGDMIKKDGNIPEAVGISCGGPLDSRRGLILSPPNLPGWDEIRITETVGKALKIPAFLQNDANAGAIAEWKYGAAKGYENVIFLTFGTGLGAGLILNGRLYSGTNDMAGEAGHIRMSDFGPTGYGKSGSLEGFCSGGGIALLAQMKAREMIQTGRKPAYLRDGERLEEITAKDVALAADKGDSTAKEILDISAEYLGRGLSILIDILNPGMIVIGGIYGRNKDRFEKRITEVIKREALRASVEVCRIVPTALGEKIGDYAALAVGALGIG